MDIVDADLNPIPHDYSSDGYVDRVIYPVLSMCQANLKVVWCNTIHKKPLDIDLINQFNADVVVIPACDHHINVASIDVRGLTKRIIILGSNNDSTFYPFWPIYYPKFVDVKIPTDSDAMNVIRKYKFSCLNGHPTDDRTVNLLHMKSRSMYDDAVLSFNIVDTGGPNATLDIENTRNMLLNVCPELVDIFDKVFPYLPIHHHAVPPMPTAEQNKWLFKLPLEITPAAYLDSYINIVTETSDNFISEKLMKPILAGQLFVTTSNQKTLNLLREMGFDIFDDIFDGHQYAEHDDIYRRIDAMHGLMERINELDMQSLYSDTVSRRMHNRELLLSGKIADRYNKRLIKILTYGQQ